MTPVHAVRQALGGLDIGCLGALDTACQENDHGTPPSGEVHPVPGPVVDAQLGDSPSDSFHIAGIAGSQALDPDLHPGSCPQIPQVVEPACEHRGRAELSQRLL